jgi:hypothetical protein
MPLQHIFTVVPALNLKVKALATDFKIRPAINILFDQEAN